MTANNTTTSRSRGYLIALIAAAILSTTAIFISYLSRTYAIPPLVLAFWRDLFVVITLLPLLMIVKPALLRGVKSHLGYLALYGLVLALFNTLWTLSVAINGAAVATVLAYSSAAFTALLGWWLLKERLTWVKLVAIALSLGGCVLVSEALDPAVWAVNLFGIITGTIAGLSYAGYSLMGRSASERGLNPWTTLLYTFGFATIFLLLFNLLPDAILPGTAAKVTDFFWLGDSFAGWGMLFLLAAGPTLAGYGLYNVSLSLLPSSTANLIVTLEPAFTVTTAYFLLGERLNAVQIIGSMLIIGGVVFLRVFEKKPAVN